MARAVAVKLQKYYVQTWRKDKNRSAQWSPKSKL